MDFVGWIGFDFVKCHQAYFLDNLTIQAHFGVKSLPHSPAEGMDLKKEFECVERWFPKFIDEEHLAYFNFQASFFIKFADKPFAGGLTKL